MKLKGLFNKTNEVHNEIEEVEKAPKVPAETKEEKVKRHTQEIFDICHNYDYDIEKYQYVYVDGEKLEFIFAVHQYPDGEHRILLHDGLNPTVRLSDLTSKIVENKISDRCLSLGRYVEKERAMQEFCPHDKTKYYGFAPGYGHGPNQPAHTECLICGRSEDGTTIHTGKIPTTWESYIEKKPWLAKDTEKRRNIEFEEKQNEIERQRAEMHERFGVPVKMG